mgnify:CR=1 FL=1
MKGGTHAGYQDVRVSSWRTKAWRENEPRFTLRPDDVQRQTLIRGSHACAQESHSEYPSRSCVVIAE